MAAVGASLDALLSAWGDGELQSFKPTARFYEAMDCVIYLTDDLAYRADRVDGFLTLLWHPNEDKLIGVKLKGFRFLFGRLQAILRNTDVTVPDAEFVPLIKAIELALTTRLTALFEKALEEDDADKVRLEEERRELESRYRQARELVDSVAVDASELLAAA
jgi:hypothetical protein